MTDARLGRGMREAVQHHRSLTVVSVRPAQVRPATEIYWGPFVYPEDSHDLELGRQTVQDFVDKAAAEIGEEVPEVTISPRLVPGATG